MIWAAVFGATTIVLLIYFTAAILGPKGLIGKNKQIKERIFKDQPLLGNRPVSVEKSTRFSDIQSFQKFMSDMEAAQKLAVQLKRAGSNLSLSAFLLMHFAIASVAFFIADLFLPPTSSIALAAVLIYFPFFYLKKKNKGYLDRFSEYLADGTSILSGSLKVGHSLETAIESVANTAPPPLSTEFKTVSAEIKLGIPVEKAFGNLYHRIKTPELKILTTAIAVHQELGGNLSELLENLEKTIRDRFGLEREIKVLSSQGIFSMWILCSLPFVMALFWLVFDPKLLFEYASSSMGITVITASFFLHGIAFSWMKRIVSINP